MRRRNPLDRLKGEVGVTTVVDALYDRLVADSVVSGRFAYTDMKMLRRHQTLFVMSATGGSQWAMGRTLAEAHTGMSIAGDPFAAVGGHLVAVLSERGVSEDDTMALVGLIGSLQPEIVGKERPRSSRFASDPPVSP
ncbi:MAG: group 1 truncated hemoglobin [Chloroflexi bacterium]|nr:group 1 truncated hemoglobin [Chloroflexota bacterium]